MKTLKVIAAAALFTGLTSLTFAGPGIEYWNRMRTAAQGAADAKAKVAAKAQPAADAMANCATCSCCAKKA